MEDYKDNNETTLDINIDIEEEDDDTQQEEEYNWTLLVEEIEKGNVIPVIGPNFLVPGNKDIHTRLIEGFAKKYNVKSKPKTFSELVYDRDFLHNVGNEKKAGNKDMIYGKLFYALERMKDIPLNEHLIKLLSTRKFPFIVTTSFTPYAEIAMKRVWGEDKVKVLQFRNNPNEDLRINKGDILNEREMQIPTVYYMFGKYSIEKHRFVVTDLDMMDFCKSWLSDNNIPSTLSKIIKKRYLLILGNNYSDWQFRYIWFSMRSFSGNKAQSLVVSSNPEDLPLIQFLERLEIFTKNDPTVVVDEIIKRLEKKNEKVAKCNRIDVFLSYSRSDEKIAKKIYDSLCSKGLSVWYDHESIPKGNRWEQEIKEGIRSCRIFVPILSTHVENEFMDAREYREEWNEAARLSSRMGGRSFIMPLTEKGFDFYNKRTKVPEEFNEINATWYDAEPDITDVEAEKIASEIKKKVDEVKELEWK